jgi:hypothetical protein
MGLNFVWENDARTILRFEASGAWTWPEYDNFIDELIVAVKAENHVVHIILTPGEQIPSGSPIPHLRRVTRLLPPNVGKIIVAGGNLFVRSINSALSKVHPIMSQKLMFAANLDEARNMLKKISEMKT